MNSGLTCNKDTGFEKIENDLTEKTIVLNLKGGLYNITIVTGNNFTTRKVFLEWVPAFVERWFLSEAEILLTFC